MEVIAVFDIGKTNKKVLLFDAQFNIVHMNEQKFETTTDEDGFECDDIEIIEKWIVSTVEEIAQNEKYDLKAVNFSTYGASLLFLDKEGKRMAPIYNYLKEVSEDSQNVLFAKYGGKEEFCRATASPALGALLNVGVQILWYKNTHPESFQQLGDIVMFPQYLSYLFTEKVTVDSTYLGCHSFMWNYDKKQYHQWIEDEQIKLPAPIDSGSTFTVDVKGKQFEMGIGIHDSSASLVPYYLAVKEKFVLMSTGTWCVSMNPFNPESLTADELENNCLNYMSIDKQPVKSTMFFMGHIHDVNVEYIQHYFKVDPKTYKTVQYEENVAGEILKQNKQVFFKNGIPEKHVDEEVDLSQFSSFEEAYQQFMYDITLQSVKYLKITFPSTDDVESLIISGGFARNVIMMNYLVNLFPEKKVFTSEIDNASALGAAMVCAQQLEAFKIDQIDLGLKKW